MIPQSAFEIFSRFQMEFETESDRGCAVLTLCVLEEQLVRSMKRRLPDIPKKEAAQLYNFAPKGALSKSTVNAYLLGILTAEELKNFSLLINIRNEFAHKALTNLRFTNDLIKNFTRNIKVGSTFPKDSNDGRAKFLIAAADLYFNMESLGASKLEYKKDSAWETVMIPVPLEKQ
ncbi:hypothetical protein ACI2KS_10505 [Pseudomonas sp. NPDC087358]|uniref:hypothetical protein n=1 Tax=Pseudomonas sp. NPDC087358 TaxID=3364439 RepID=UPI0038513F4A